MEDGNTENTAYLCRLVDDYLSWGNATGMKEVQKDAQKKKAEITKI